MKKRLLCLVLAVVLLLSVVPAAQAIAPLCFVAMNDTIPLTLKSGAAPYYTSGALYLPYTAFNISPNGVGATYNVEMNTFVLFNANETLIFDLEKDVYTDKKGQEYPVDVAYRNGLLYVSSKVLSHFELSVTILYSRAGYPIIRFTNGGQVYDDGTFVAQAENLINRAAQEYEKEQENQDPAPGTEVTEPEEEIPAGQPPVEVYLAFRGDAVSETTLEKLADCEVQAAFFLTEEQILMERDLVRAIYAAGHMVGVTAAPEASDLAEALRRANDALDQVLFFRSVLALLPADSTAELDSVHILRQPAQKTVEELLTGAQEPQLYIVSTGAPGVIASLVNAEASICRLRETTF